MEKDSKLSFTVMEAIKSGRKIDAIKLLREERGIDLKEAKTVIDTEIKAYRKSNPESVRQPGSGKLSWLVVVVILTAVLYYIFGKL